MQYKEKVREITFQTHITSYSKDPGIYFEAGLAILITLNLITVFK